VPKPDVGKWNVTDYSFNKTYILAEMAVQLNITYDGDSGKVSDVSQLWNLSAVYGPLIHNVPLSQCTR
jgi:hypothetical protein